MRMAHKPIPPKGETRIVERYLWRPLSLVNKATWQMETRWLETARIEEMFIRPYEARCRWVAIAWPREECR